MTAPGSAPVPLVAAAKLSRRFGDRRAVDDLSFDVCRGEILALLGPNGAGKTTTMRMLAGLLRPDHGVITLDGVAVGSDTAPLRARVGLLTEAPGLWDRLTLAENLLVHARLHGLPSPAAAVERALARMGLEARAADRAGTLSKGMRQKAAIARALMHAPDIFLLDEPTSGLDPAMARAVRDRIVDLRQDGCAIVLASHNLDEVERLADRVVVINTRVVAAGTPGDLKARARQAAIALVTLAEPLVSAAAVTVDRLGATIDAGQGADGDERHGPQNRGVRERLTLRIPLPGGERDVPAIVRELVACGAAITSVAVERPALEDVYLGLVRDEAGNT